MAEVQFSWRVGGYVVAYYSVDFASEGLDRDFTLLDFEDLVGRRERWRTREKGAGRKRTGLPFQPHLCVGIIDRVCHCPRRASDPGKDGLLIEFVILSGQDGG